MKENRIDEQEARRLLQENQIERAMEDRRSCLEIASTLGLLTVAQTIELTAPGTDIAPVEV